MINHIENYAEAGKKEAVARNQHDEACAAHWRDFYRRMLATETVDDKVAASEAYTTAYTENRNVPPAVFRPCTF